MSEKRSFLSKYVTEIVLFALFIYAFLPILSPILFSYNPDSNLAIGIQKFYSHFCHQRVDRSIFLFGGEDSQFFYSLDELKERNYLPENDERLFGYPYWGNEEIGYKVAFCVRDTALYSAFVLFGALLVLYMNRTKKIPKFHWSLILLLVLPMAIDGVFQTVASIFEFPWVPEFYMESIVKRIVTGVLFGIGVSMWIFTNLKDASSLRYNE
jgi:uncharacterized membrane protein